ncbi:2'-5' RNA ligase family protein [Altererythrobacter sp.]|nr:2'-5' RNA ligase family protein [Altererythrobacter sp.]
MTGTMAGPGESAGSRPLILTAQLPKDMHRWATALRTAHFPPERNYLEAHVTLFHALPPQCEEELCAFLKRIAGEFAPPDGQLTGLMSLGGGTALKLASPGILRIRDEIAERFHGMLTAQDQHTPRLHVTIQNKVSSKEAKALQTVLSEQVEPRAFSFRGLALHHYLGGPWGFVKDFSFRGSAAA